MKTKETFMIALTAVAKRLWGVAAAGRTAVGLVAGIALVAGTVGMTGCSQGGNVTKLNGTIIDGDGFEEVNIAVEKYAIDTLVPVVNGKFSIDLPADPAEMAFVSAGYYTGYFILDGTRLDMTLGEKSTVTSKARKSLQNEYNVFEEKVTEMTDDFQAQLMLLMQEEDLTQEEYDIRYELLFDSVANEIVAYVEQTAMDNKDNAISGVAVNKLNGAVEDESLLDLINMLSDGMQESIFVAPLRQEVEIRLQTAEGQPFKDFTIEDSDGKTVSLSDYVGKGKYILVDFWASWCQPCREEIPNIKAAYNKYHNKGFDVVSVAIADEPQDSKAAAKELGMNWNLIINAGQLPAEVYGFSAIPQIMLFGPDGTILKKGLRGEGILEEIGKYIK